MHLLFLFVKMTNEKLHSDSKLSVIWNSERISYILIFHIPWKETKDTLQNLFDSSEKPYIILIL